ncbi:MAG: SDR family oxidoreductase [Halieaceae bacterium]|nr:SDR family oxidoreductase [Halieaceae bacterium]
MSLCEGRVAVVTGAGRGLGRAHALMLAKNGAKVVVNDLGGEKDGRGQDIGPAQGVVDEIITAGGQAVANGANVADWQQAQEMIEQAVDTFGGLDILINNAGILRDKMLWNFSEYDFDAVVEVNLKGTFAPLHHAANYWRLQSKAGNTVDARVINTTSSSGLFGNLGQANYASAKAGVASMTIVAALELKRIGVTVNAIAPRAESRMTAGLIEQNEEQFARRNPDYVASLVTWLASRESSDITGRFFEAWGGGYAVLEGIRHGAQTEATLDDPASLGEAIHRIVRHSQTPSHYNRGQFYDI